MGCGTKRGEMRAIASLGCGGSMRAIASSMPPYASPQQDPTPKFSAATAGGITTAKPSAPPRRHYQRPQLVKGKSPQGPRVTVQIEQYLLCSAEQLKSRFSTAAAASRLTSSMLPHVSLGASQLLKSASTTPRSYGRKHRPWHHGHVHATHNERRRGQRRAHHDQVHAWRLYYSGAVSTFSYSGR